MQVGLRKALMASLVGAFVAQTALVYADDTADRTPPLSELARDGRRIWHAHNCQACHQIYGFGGFLGPDLTNAAPRMTLDYLGKVLTVGPNDGKSQMPAFHLDEDQIAAVQAFFIELNETGIGVPRAFERPAPSKVFEAIRTHAAATGAPPAVTTGLSMFEPVCGACHTPFCATPLGPHTAPDLSTVCDRLDDASILMTITAGRTDRGMPAHPHLEAFAPNFVTMMQWLQQQRSAITERLGDAKELGLPWWEFK